jgi:hypothetical protein
VKHSMLSLLRQFWVRPGGKLVRWRGLSEHRRGAYVGT